MITYHAQKISFFNEHRLWMKKGVDLFNVTVAMYGISQVLNSLRHFCFWKSVKTMTKVASIHIKW